MKSLRSDMQLYALNCGIYPFNIHSLQFEEDEEKEGTFTIKVTCRSVPDANPKCLDPIPATYDKNLLKAFVSKTLERNLGIGHFKMILTTKFFDSVHKQMVEEMT